MLGLLEVVILERGDTRLPSLFVHFLQLGCAILLHVAFNDLNNLLVICQVRTLPFQANHVERCGGLQRAMDVEELIVVLSLIEIRGHPAVAIGLGCKQVGIYVWVSLSRPCFKSANLPLSFFFTSGSNLDSPSTLAI